ncbi:MAG: SGNH/GDSL hydrolase family protein [Chloroflexi bacterium]|nr:SGNH/GDSL hydrolase family protein [Chloroflexota bacterium]MBI4316049.1 SGNH/GDSL hydrolase family protein [Chloroflexota bacterium]
MHTRLSSWFARVIVLVLVIAVAAPQPAAASAYPASMASLGDSITRAFNTGNIPFKDAPDNSWSTGINPSVNSLYSRILVLEPGISGHNYNLAKSGSEMSDLAGQVTRANAQHVEYVTILLGANDACAGTEAAMTSVQTFHDQFYAAMTTLAAGSPNAKVFIVSVPNIHRLWELFHNNSAARRAWKAGRICQSMLANPASMRPADVNRRARVLQRVADYNAQLAAVCALFANCHTDSGAAFTTTFVASDVSTRDYFHPSLAGQAKIAAVLWPYAIIP